MPQRQFLPWCNFSCLRKKKLRRSKNANKLLFHKNNWLEQGTKFKKAKEIQWETLTPQIMMLKDYKTRTLKGIKA